MFEIPASLFTTDLAIMTLAFVASGLIRGFTGGAGANFLTAPVLAAIVGPREAVPIVLLLNGVTNVQLLPGAIPDVKWREVMPMGIAAGITMPLGAWALFTIDEDVMRRVVAGVAVGFALLLLTGWRYRGRHGTGISIAAGGTAGALTGAVSMGGPPVFLYLMSGDGSAAANRAHFIIFATVVQVVAMVVLFGAGAYSAEMLWLAVLLLVPYVLTTWLGTHLFRRTGEAAFRRVSLWCMVAVSLAVLII